MKKIKELIEVILILYLIIVIIYCYIQISTASKKKEETINKVELKVGEEKKYWDGGEIYINNYSIYLSDFLVDYDNYTITNKDGVLRIKADTDYYEAAFIQLTDKYIKPSDEEIDKLYNSKKYKKSKDKENLKVNYFKKLGYNTKNSFDYTLTQENINNQLKEFYKNDFKSTGSSYKKNDIYDCTVKTYKWGMVSTYRMFYNSKTKDKRLFSGYFMIFEYFDQLSERSREVTLNTIYLY